MLREKKEPVASLEQISVWESFLRGATTASLFPQITEVQAFILKEWSESALKLPSIENTLGDFAQF